MTLKLKPGPVNYERRPHVGLKWSDVGSACRESGIVYILGIPHHIQFIPVGVDLLGIQHARLDGLSEEDAKIVRERWEDAQRLVGGGYLTPVEIPGREGQFAIVIFPFSD